MLDYVISGRTSVDGTGSPPRRRDVAVRDGLIAASGDVDQPALRKIDADTGARSETSPRPGRS